MQIKKFIFAALVGSFAVASQASIISTFDASAEGWTAAGGLPAFSYMSTGGVGNSGYIQTIDLAGGQMVAVSPAFGNQSSTYGGVLSFSYNVLSLLSRNTYSANAAFGTVTIASGGSFVTADLIAPIFSNIAGTGWHLASLDLNNSLWTGNASLSAILANVTGVSIVTEYDQSRAYPDEVVGIDNFSLRAIPVGTVPEPESIALLAIGLVASFGAARRRNR